MKILVVDADLNEAATLTDQLDERGHEVVRCFPENGDTLCAGAKHPEQCPVESLGCDVALIVRESGSEPTLREMGAICAVRRHIPLIEARPDESSPYASWSTPTGAAIVDAVEEMDFGVRPRLVQAVENRLATLPAVQRLGRVPTVSVRRRGSSLHMTIALALETTRGEEDSIVTWSVRALRETDPHTSTVDITIRRV